MSQNTVITDPINALPGMDGGGLSDNISRIVSSQQLERVLIAGNDNGTFTITLDGTLEATFDAVSNTVAQIAADLLADMASPTAAVTAEADGVDAILIEMTDEWDTDGFASVVASDGTSTDITTTTLVPQGQTLEAGLGVCADDRAAAVGSSGQQCRLPRQATDITARFLGITRLDTALEANAGAVYQNRSAVSIRRKGRTWVRVQDAVAEMADVYCRYSTPVTGYGLGSFRSDADSSKAAQVPNAKYLIAADATGLALVEQP